MVSGSSTRWDAAEQWSPILFLIGGALLVGHAAVQSIEAFTTLTPPPDMFVMAGHLVALIGLVGLYPALVNQSPRLTRGASVVAAITLTGWSLMTIVRFLAVTGIVSPLSEVFPGVFFVLMLATMVLTYALFGVATLRVNEEDSRTIGLLVSAPGALLLVLLVDSALTGASAIDGVVIGGGLALSMVTLGYSLRKWRRPINRGAPAGQQTRG